MAETTSSEFVLWKVYLQEEDRFSDENPTRDQYYMAQIAQEVYRIHRSLSRRGPRSKLSSFILKFTRKGGKKKEKPKLTLDQAKSFFFGLAGMKKPD